MLYHVNMKIMPRGMYYLLALTLAIMGLQSLFFVRHAAAADYASIIEADSPVDYWRLNEASGTSAKDIVGVNDGTINATGVTYSQSGLLAASSTSMCFDGSSGDVSLPAGIQIPQPLSLEFWFKPATPLGNEGVVGTGGYGFELDATTQLFHSYENGASYEQFTPTYGNTYYVVVTSAANNLLSTYIGTGGSVTAQGSGNPGGTLNYSFNMGGNNYVGLGPHGFFKGCIEDVALYNKILTPSQMSAHYTAGTTTPPNAPTALGPTQFVNGSWGTSNQPAITFDISDPNPSPSDQYEVQISASSSFVSPAVDYTSALAAPGSETFTVGQPPGGGNYTSGASGQMLADGQYYWRVKAIDNIGYSSAFTTAASGGVAFGVDTTGPSVPSQPATSSPTTNTTPAWSWQAVSDSGSGLAATPYIVQWSQDKTFAAGVTTSTVALTTFKQPVALAAGTWYFRVRASDVLGNTSIYSAPGTVNITAVQTPAPAITSPAAAANESPARPSAPTIPAEVSLESFPDYVSGNGKQLSLVVGQQVSFESAGISYVITLEDTSGAKAAIVFSAPSYNRTIAIGTTTRVDVNGDGHADIAITVLSVGNGSAVMRFAAVKLPASTTEAGASRMNSSSAWSWVLLLAASGGAAGIWIRYKINHHRR